MASYCSDRGTVAAGPPPSGVHLPATIAAIFWTSGRQDARGRMSGSGTLWQAMQRALARAWPFEARAGAGAAASRAGSGGRTRAMLNTEATTAHPVKDRPYEG